MKKIIYGFFVVLIGLISNKVMAEVIYIPYHAFGHMFSIEGIVSYEIPITNYNTVNFWGGIGVIAAHGDLQYPAFGTEIAAEIRQYFKSEKYKGFNIGLYSGFAIMRYPDLIPGFRGYKNSIGFVPGIKLTYKFRFNNSFMIGPYLSLSLPNYKAYEGFGIAWTLGLRVGLNQIK